MELTRKFALELVNHSTSRRVLGVKWPMSFIGAIKKSLIRNETLKESPMIIHH